MELGVRRIRTAPHSIPVNSEFLGMSFEDITYAAENNLVLSTRNPQWSRARPKIGTKYYRETLLILQSLLSILQAT